MRVLICPDKFKGTLTAVEAADAIASGVRDVLPDAELRLLPVADGGEGTVDAFVAAGAEPRVTRVAGPLGEPVDATWAVFEDTAVIELAAASGLALVRPSDETALTASTDGTGDLMRAALDAGVRRIIVGLGGSATTDAAAGALRALGARLIDRQGRAVGPGTPLTEIVALDASGVDHRLQTVPVVLCADVGSPLLGLRGAARVFGPQKGASATTVDLLERGLSQWAALLAESTGVDVASLPWGGAAGGSAAGLHAGLGAEYHPGVDLVADLLGVDDALRWADVVIVGEGSLDDQTLEGKAPVGIARRAVAAGVPVLAVVGRVVADEDALTGAGIDDWASATEVAGSSEAALADAARWTRVAAASLMEFQTRQLPHLSAAEFDQVVSEALDSIPHHLAASISNVAIMVEDEPTLEQKGHAIELFGLYEGVPLTERNDAWFGSLPDRITIFQGPLQRVCRDVDELRHEIAVTVVHEVAHHFGIDDERLHELGWG